MIVPHYDAILHALGTSRKAMGEGAQVKIPVSLLNFLLIQALEHAEFNESGYLAANPDVASAVKAKKIASAKQHYVSTGFLEGRRGAMPAVDEAWYAKTNSDVAAAIRSGKLRSAAQHFEMIGAEEFRAPSEEYLESSYQWKVAVGKARSKR